MPKHFELLRSLEKDSPEPVETRIVGELPHWLSGSLFKNGAGRFEYVGKNYEHFFDGHACVHKFSIAKGKVLYSNKLLETKSFKRSLAENRLYPVFGTPDLSSNLFGRLRTMFHFHETMDNVNVNVVPYGNDQIYALTESNYVCRVDPHNFNILETIDVKKHIPTASTSTAHPHLDPQGWIMCGYNARRMRLCYEFMRYPQAPTEPAHPGNICTRAKSVGRIVSSHWASLSYFHSFGVTQNYIVFVEQALTLSLPKFFFGLFTNNSYADALVMKKNFNTRVHLIDKRTGKNACVHGQKFYTLPLFLFHHINAYETYDADKKLSEIHVDVCAYDPNKFDIQALTYEDMFTENLSESDKIRSVARRIIVPMHKLSDEATRGKSVFCELIDLNAKVSFELPVINYARFNGLQYKYVYGLNNYKAPFSIVKLNMDDSAEFHERVYDSEETGKCLPSEPVFVESPHATSEDDGVLLVIVLGQKNDFLSVLDAKNLSELARANVPEHVKASMTFHGKNLA